MGLAFNKGRQGEDIALGYLQGQGYSLITRNFRARATEPLSEIDLVLLQGPESCGLSEVLIAELLDSGRDQKKLTALG